jgi:Na+(H+)/acetate symporter ActP
MTIKEDEILKGAVHGLFAGCLLPVLLYNIFIKRWRNVGVYGAVLGFEFLMIKEHVDAARKQCEEQHDQNPSR